MLVIRLQRTGRKGHANFRIIVQDSRKSPTSGNVVEFLGSYNPHTKIVVLDKDKTALFIKNGAQPSPRVSNILKVEGVKLPKWVLKEGKKKKNIKNPEKRRSTAPKGVTVEKPVKEEETKPEAAEQPAEEAKPDESEKTEATPTPDVKDDVSDKPDEAPKPEEETAEAPAEVTPEPEAKAKD